MSNLLNLRRCQEADLPQLRLLFKEVYKFNPRLQELDYFNWQFKFSPYNQENEYTFWLLEEKEQIRGFLGYIPLELQTPNKIYRACYTANWHSFIKDASSLLLINQLVNDFNTVIIVGFTPVAKLIYKLNRVPVLDEIPRWLGVINKEKVNDLFQITGKSDLKEQIHRNRLIGETNNPRVYRIKGFDDNQNFFFTPWQNIKYYIRRTGKFLNWRYVRIPRHNYQILYMDNGQYAVYRIENIKDLTVSVVRLIEWTFSGEAGKSALGLIIEDAIQNNAILIDFFCTALEIGRELEKIGFIRSDVGTSPIPYLFRPMYYTEGIGLALDTTPHRVSKKLDFSEWYVTKGDGDVDRIKL